MPDPVTFHPIGVIHTPFLEQRGTPVQPAFAGGAEGTVELLPEYVPGLADLEGFERIWLLFHLDRGKEPALRVVPYRDTQERGLFATRAPARPNAIGLSCVRLLGVQGNILRIADVDMLDGSPLLDIKPYARVFDEHPTTNDGWLSRSQDVSAADDRFLDTNAKESSP
ncbi:MAG: tRNA (N6-threonylcarbamoyladenosine(37)-N6)-methyltransferase TrmO [Phycisphaerales bacterium JB038]